MGIEKPPKRLVHLEQYLTTIGKKSALYSSATALGGTGVALVVTAGLLSWLNFHAPIAEIPRFLLSLLDGGIALSGCAALWFAFVMFHRAREIEPVAPITKYNADQLPVSETLVRASARPLTEQGTELLRPLTHQPETPSDQLLRATHTDE